MDKLLWILLFAPIFILMHAYQADQELAVHAFFRAKYGLNYAVHAAAQQVDEEKLAHGVLSIDEEKALKTAMRCLRSNLQLDDANMPLQDAFFKSRIDVLEFEVIGEEANFPYHYVHPVYDYEVTLRKPGVIMIIQVEYPRIFGVLEPISWQVKSSAELYLH